MHFRRAHLSCVTIPFFCFMLSHTRAEASLDVATILKNLNAAYALVNEYQTKVEVRIYQDGGSFETERFLYSFKKPKRIRIDFESPHPGTILVYPDENGKVVVRPSGLAHFLRFHLKPDSSLLKDQSGQRIDQTDMGLLIKNISNSLTDGSRGPVEIVEENDLIRIRVLAINHFRPDKVTLYEFFIDAKLWLPVKVIESTPEGHLQRTVNFAGLRINPGLPETFFQIDKVSDDSDGPTNWKQPSP